MLIVANLVVKGFYLATPPLAGDEPFTVYHAQMDLMDMLRVLAGYNNPPLMEIILHYWIKVWGISELSVRVPSLLFSSATIGLIYLIGCRFINRRIGWYAAIIFLFSNYHVALAHEARVYTLMGMLTTLSVYLYLSLAAPMLSARIPRRPKTNSLGILVALAITNILLIYAHYFGFFIVALEVLYTLMNRRLTVSARKPLVMVCIAIGVAYIPHMKVLYTRFIVSAGQGTWIEPPNGFTSIYNMLWQFSNAPVVTTIVITILVAAFAKHLATGRKKPANPFSEFIVIWFFSIFGFMFGISYLVPMFLDRYLMPAAVGFPILLALSSDYLIPKLSFRSVIPLVICLLFAATVKPNLSNKREIDKAVSKIKEIRKPNSLVLLCPHHFVLTFAYHYDQNIFKLTGSSDSYKAVDSALKCHNIYAIDHIGEVNPEGYNQILYLDAASSFTHPENQIVEQINNTMELKNKYYFYEIFNVYEYEYHIPKL